MGSRSYLYITTARKLAEGIFEPFAEADNAFPTLWKLLLAPSTAGQTPAHPQIVNRLPGRPGSGALVSPAPAALERLQRLAAFMRGHPGLRVLPQLSLQFDALQAHLAQRIAAWSGPDEDVLLSADLDQLSWQSWLSSSEDSPETFLSDCADECMALWNELQHVIEMKDHAALDAVLELHSQGRRGGRWQDWAWSFGFGGITHAYFHQRDEPLDVPFEAYVPPSPDDLGEGLRRFERNGAWGVRARSGDDAQVLLTPEWEQVQPSACGDARVVWVMRDRRFGLARADDSGGTLLLSPVLDKVWDFSQGVARVKQDGKQGLLQPDGGWLMPPSVDELWPFERGFAAARVGKLQGFVTLRGTWAIAPQYDEVGVFRDGGLASVKQGGQMGLVRHSGELAVPLSYEAIEWSDSFQGYEVRSSTGMGVLHADGSPWIVPQWQDVQVLVPQRLMAVRNQAQQMGVLDWQGEVRIEPAFSDVSTRFDFDLPKDDPLYRKLRLGPVELVVREGGRAGLIDDTGQVRVPVGYDGIDEFSPQFFDDEPALNALHMVRVQRKGEGKSRRFGAFDMARGVEAVAPVHDVLDICSFGGGDFGFIAAQRTARGNWRLEMLRCDGSPMHAMRLAWLATQDLPNRKSGLDRMRRALHDAWHRARPVPAANADGGEHVWLHADGTVQSVRAHLESRYRLGDLAAAWQLARRLRHGDGMAQDQMLARRWMERAAGLRDAAPALPAAKPPALAAIRSWLQPVRPVAPASPLPQNAAPGGLPGAMHDLADMLLHGQGGQEDPAAARAWLEHALAHATEPERDGIAVLLGFLLYEGLGGTPHPQRAVALWQQAAGRHDATAHYNLGIAHANDRIGPPDPGKALAHFRQADALGHAGAAYEAGKMLLRTKEAAADEGGPSRQRAQAVHFLQKAADDEHSSTWADACQVLASLHLRGDGMARNEEEAERWLLRGAHADHPGCLNDLLVFLYAEPKSRLYSPEKADAWLKRRSAALGS
jgi:TPR repeat protein